MDSVFRSAREKLEKEHGESKETGKLRLEREKKDKEAALRQRQAVEASQRARRFEAIESQTMKADESAERQRQDVEAYRRARRRFEAIESQMMEDEDNLGEEKEEDDIRRVGGDYIIEAIPPWMKTNMPQRIAQEGDDDDEEGAKWEIGDAPGAGNCKRFILNVRAEKERKKRKKKTTAAGKNTES